MIDMEVNDKESNGNIEAIYIKEEKEEWVEEYSQERSLYSEENMKNFRFILKREPKKFKEKESQNSTSSSHTHSSTSIVKNVGRIERSLSFANPKLYRYNKSFSPVFNKNPDPQNHYKNFDFDVYCYPVTQKGEFGSNLAALRAENKPYECTICSYAASRRNDLERHLRTHSGEKPFKCDLCPYAAAQKINLQNHLRTHSGEKPFKCEACSFAAIRKIDLRNHLKIHRGEKPFKCDLCSYASVRRGDLEKHMRIHTGEKPYKCDICPYAAAQKINLRSHMKTHLK